MPGVQLPEVESDRETLPALLAKAESISRSLSVWLSDPRSQAAPALGEQLQVMQES